MDGSHFIVRSDVEASIGWDFGEITVEDFIFSYLLKHNSIQLSILKGFAYERPTLTYKDFLRQRRWVKGMILCVFRSILYISLASSSLLLSSSIIVLGLSHYTLLYILPPHSRLS